MRIAEFTCECWKPTIEPERQGSRTSCGYPAEVQDLIRRAWAAPPPNVDGQVAEELVARLRLDRMKGRHSGIIRELSEAERGREAERVARLEAEARELARAIND